MRKLALHWQILIALILAAVVGIGFKQAVVAGVPLIDVYDFVGTIFLNALKMIIVPLVVSSIITGVAGLGAVEGFGRLGLKTMGYYMMTSLIAILIGLMLVNAFQPGIVDGHPARANIPQSAETQAALDKVGDKGPGAVVQVLQRLVPSNVVEAAVKGDMLGLIFFSLVFGYFMTRLGDQSRATLLGFWQALNDVMLLITNWVMLFAPIGVFALVAKVFATTGLEAIQPVIVFALTVLIGLAVHTLVVMPLLLFVLGRVNPWRHFKAMAPAMITAFSTDSSMATLPVTMDCVENRAGVSNRTSSFVLPLGATINMDGTALYECVAAVFIAQAYGIELSFATQFTIVLLALLTSIGVAGIPAASLVAIVIILRETGVPVEGIGMILAVDRLLDMCRTTVNIFSDSCGAVIIARSEGEEKILQ